MDASTITNWNKKFQLRLSQLSKYLIIIFTHQYIIITTDRFLNRVLKI